MMVCPCGMLSEQLAKRRRRSSRFSVDELEEKEGEVEEKKSKVFLGRRKVGVDDDAPIRRSSIYPLVRQNGSKSFHVFTATLMDPFNASKVAVVDGSNCQAEIEILQTMGCYGYPPEDEARREDVRPSKLFLFDTETPTQRLWDLLVSPSNPSSHPALTPFHLRYAAYLYYRSRGWIVRPALTLGGVDFLLYAESPRLRHAAYAVIVMPASASRSARDVAAHLRVASSVAKVVHGFSGTVHMHYERLYRLVIAEVGVLVEAECKDRPWENVKNYAIEETLLTRAPNLV
ncbi:unnamed protein product [Hydatigera taeniaeformis]|uniref:tRNA-intron lyase n=1 Tax=Hydatigena taeniaeformis TaxID=6205 RepID=A0A0R3X6D6_HYDTA|nr:unnamed protein product [Hydatigera taeniaeformis]